MRVQMHTAIIQTISRSICRSRERLRQLMYKRASIEVLVLGDSHVRVFEHWRFLFNFPRTRFEVVYVPGGTAAGMRNRASKTGAYNAFLRALSYGKHDLVLVNLGEVDTAYALWQRAKQSGKSVAELMASSVKNYCDFLGEIHKEHQLAVLSACLPTLADHADTKDEVASMRSAVEASQQARTALALEFNGHVAAFCAQHAIPYLNCASAALGPNGVVCVKWVNQSRHDHHYSRATYARWLVRELKKMPVRADTRPR